MEVATRPIASRMPAWQPLVLVALLLVAVAAAVLLAGGLRSAPLPEPFGPAANGPIYFSTADGDILAVDDPTGVPRTIVGGAAFDEGPWFSPRGDRLLFARIEDRVAALMVADAQGSRVRDVTPSTGLGDWVEWSPDGDRLVVVGPRVTPARIALVSARDGRERTLEYPFRVDWAAWRPGHDQLAIAGGEARENFVWLADPDGTLLEKLPVEPGFIGNPSFSADGRRMAYTTWTGDAGAQGRIHVLDLETGIDTLLTPDLEDGFTRLGPQFSPDGETVLLERYARDDTFTMALVAADGSGSEVPLGPAHPQGTGGAAAGFSPDGTAVLATYRDNGAAWLLPVDGSPGTRLDWATPGYWTWQRLAE